MTFETMQSHESVTLHYAGTDFRRQGLIALVSDHVTGKSVLDLRCLRGDLAVKLLKEGRSVSGLDGYQQAGDNQTGDDLPARSELEGEQVKSDGDNHQGLGNRKGRHG